MSEDQLPLLGRESVATDRYDDSPVEHAELPEAARRERSADLVFSFDTEADRDELVKLLGLRVTGGSSRPRGTYPPEDENELRLDLDA